MLSALDCLNTNPQDRNFSENYKVVNALCETNEQLLSKKKKLGFGLNNNQLKIIAMITMLIEHIGVSLLPSVALLRIIGRISFPIFAYMIAEGCTYTKNRLKYFLTVFLLGFGCQTAYFIVMRSLYQNILLAFALAILAIFSLDAVIKKNDTLKKVLGTVGFLMSAFVSLVLPALLQSKGFAFDYGEYAFVLPIIIYYMPDKWWKIGTMTIILTYRALTLGWIHWFSLIPLALLALYKESFIVHIIPLYYRV